MSAKTDLFINVIVCFVGFLGGCALVSQTFEQDEKDVRVEAVKHGYAEWIPNEKGETKFQWKEKP